MLSLFLDGVSGGWWQRARLARRGVVTLVLATLLLGAVAGSGLRAAPRAVEEDVPYLAADRKEKLDVYRPEPPAAGQLSPAVVWIHGGGWDKGEKGEQRAQEICGTLAGAGYFSVSIAYRLGPGAWPTSLHDCKNAVRFLRAHAQEFRIDPERIYVAGGSAGGHLALLVGFTADQPAFEPSGAQTPYAGVSSHVRAVVDLYGPTDLLHRKEVDKVGQPTGGRKPGGDLKVFGAKDEDDDVFRIASPLEYVTPKCPPVLVIHGLIDPTVDLDQSRKLVAALEKAGVPHQFELVAGAGHAFDFETWQQKPLSRDLRPVVLDFLRRH